MNGVGVKMQVTHQGMTKKKGSSVNQLFAPPLFSGNVGITNDQTIPIRLRNGD